MLRGVAARIGGPAKGAARRFEQFDVLLLTAAIWFLAKFLRYAFPPLFEELQGVYDVSVAALGTAFTGFMLVYAAMQFPSGVVADRIGAARVITAGAIVASGGALVVVLGGPFGLLVVAMLVMGAGTGAHKTVAIQLLSRTYPARTGRALGVLDTLGTFGGVAAPLVVAAVLVEPATVERVLAGTAAVLPAEILDALTGVLIAGLDWRTVFLGAGGIALVFAGLFVVRVPDGEATSTGGDDRSLAVREYLEPFRAPRLATFVLVTLGFSFAYNGVVAFLPLFLSQEVGLSKAAESLLYSLFFVVSVVQVGSGELSDRVGRLPVIAGALSLAAGSLALLLAWGGGAGPIGHFGGAAVAVVGLGVGSHGFRPVRGAHLTALLPDRVAGGGLGVVRTGLMGAGAVAPAVVGTAATVTGSFRLPFGLLLGALGISAVLALVLLATDR